MRNLDTKTSAQVDDKYIKAFSLVELSIVLVILGLIVGAVLGGQSLMRAAELRGVATQTSQFRTAIYTFRNKYFALPGDMLNAVQFWGAQAGGTANGEDATCAALTYASPATGTATCNGNGDGEIGSQGATTANKYEIFRAWQHLSNAGLIEGSYIGVSGPGGAYGQHALIGENVPASRINNAGATIKWRGTVVDGANNFGGDYGNVLFYGAQTATSVTDGKMLMPEEAWNIDKKLDDGTPSYGSIRQYKSPWAPSCTTTDVAATSEYNLSLKEETCNLLISLES